MKTGRLLLVVALLAIAVLAFAQSPWPHKEPQNLTVASQLPVLSAVGNLAPQASCQESEPNDTAAEADLLQLGECGGEANVGDPFSMTIPGVGPVEDIWKAVINQTTKVDITLTIQNSTANLDLYIGTITGNSFTKIAFSEGNTTTERVAPTLFRGTYYVGVRAKTNGSPYILKSIFVPVPPAPSNLSAVALSPTTIRLTWQDNSAVEDHFRIEQKAASGAWQALTPLIPGGPGIDKEATISNATPGTTYTFRVIAVNSAGQASSNEATVTTPAATNVCVPNNETLCLLNGRFEITLSARDQRTGATAKGQPRIENDLFAFFSLASLTGSAEIPEVFVKILDATALPGQNFWVFYSGLTDLEYTLTVTDKQKNQQKVFTKEAGSFCGNTDQSTFTLDGPPELYTAAHPGHVSGNAIEPSFTCGAASLCLLGTRFDVSLSARDQRTGRTATGVPVAKSDGFGYFSLTELTGDPRVPEVFVKMIDASAPPFNKFWVFHGGLTDLEYTLTVRDNSRGTVRIYTKAPGSFCGEADTAAFNP